MKFPRRNVARSLAAFFLCGVCTVAKDYRIVVETPKDSENAITRVSVPADFPTAGELAGEGAAIPFQREDEGVIVFIAPELKANQKRTFTVGAKTAGTAAIRADWKDGTVEIASDGKPVLTYRGEEGELPQPDIKPEFKRGGYIHPVFTPGGKQVTDHYPPNHLHQQGIWFPWTKTVFEGRTPDFWNMGQGKGKVEFVKLGHTWSGPVHAGFAAHHRFVDLTATPPKAALNETWKVTAYHIPRGDYWVFDLVSTQTCASASPLQLPQYHYGGLGFRGNWAWNGADQCFFLTSTGETNRVKGNETRANWCHISGRVDGQLAGIAILSHPDNFRAPQPMRVHPSEPFFCFAPSQLGDWEISQGKPYVSRYRFIVKDGAPDRNALQKLWEQYATPSVARVEVNGP